VTTPSSPEPLPDLALSRAVVDRAAHHRTDDEWLASTWARRGTGVLRVRGTSVAVRGEVLDQLDVDTPVDVAPAHRYFLGVDRDDRPWFAADLDAAGAPDDGGDFRTLREVGTLLDARDAGLVVHAVSLANWHAAHTHCPRCGTPTVPENAGHTRRCPDDRSEHYPRTDPAVIMLVVDDDDRLLLGRQTSWPERRFSTLAGFVEPGESLEAAVRREVAEECGVRIGAVTYLGSQPWPFPSSLMLGFTAHAETTDVVRHDGEIAEARWYDRESMRADIDAGELLVSPSISISRRLIEHWYGAPLPENTAAWAR
jgi:NAD+ diphosphatase